MTARSSRKRAAFEPLAAVEPVDPEMRRPAATVAGGVLVLLRAVAGVIWGASVVYGLPPWMRSAAAAANGTALEPDTLTLSDLDVGFGLFAAVLGVIFVVQVVFGILVLRGSNPARVAVMIVSVVSISAAFVGWWDLGADITVRTTLATLSLDVLVLLALSSRDAAAFAHRRRRRREPVGPRTGEPG
ncbi:hypothetical protein CH252_09335 [Rhodococcus sp. 06-1477-1B]|nr:hypothetical protein CH252_09335 [Rhodococcus sp. 06-1477-1B]